MNSIKTIGGAIVLLSIYAACGNKQSDQVISSDLTSSAEGIVNNSHSANMDTSFEAQNYLWLSKLYLGPVFENAETGTSLFFRIVEIAIEEQIFLYVEKISIGEEGGSYRLINRYRLDEKELGLPNFSRHLDSLSFIDSVRVVGYFNKIKYSIDLDTRTAVKN